MSNGVYTTPFPANEPVKGYAPGSPEKESLLAKYKEMYNQEPIEVPLYIGSEEITTNDKRRMSPPHDHAHNLGSYNYGTKEHVTKAIDAALSAKADWANMPWEHRASIFLKAADLLEGPFRDELNASTMLAQSKNAMQAASIAFVTCSFVP